MCRDTFCWGGGCVLINWLNTVNKKGSQKILLPTLFQHGCLLTKFLANLKILGARRSPTPPKRHIPALALSYLLKDTYQKHDKIFMQLSLLSISLPPSLAMQERFFTINSICLKKHKQKKNMRLLHRCFETEFAPMKGVGSGKVGHTWFFEIP